MHAYWSMYLTSSTMTRMTKELMETIDKMLELIIFFFSKQPNTNDDNKTKNGTTDQRMLIFCKDPPYSHNSFS